MASVIVLTGLALRVRLATTTYLNPDEASHALLAQGSWSELFRDSLRASHPPLIILINHFALMISHAELAVRLVPLLAGSLFPVVLSFWLWKTFGKMAALAGLLLLTLAPNLVIVSAEYRSYTLMLLFVSASLVVLEEALDRDQWQWMALYSLMIWLGVLSDYSMAWFVGSAGVYCLLRLGGASRAVKATWVAGQLVAGALYIALFLLQIRMFRGGPAERDAILGWLSAAFPKPGGMLTFPFVNTVKQFAYLMASIPAGMLAVVMFAAALWWLWTGRTGIERNRARSLVLLMVVPFLLNIAAAYAQLFPYGRSRQGLLIALFGACGIAVFVQMLPRRAATAVLCAGLIVTPLWHRTADEDPQNISPTRNRKELILECLNYMRAAIPPNSLIFTENETLQVLAYYENSRIPSHPFTRQFVEASLGPWRVATGDYKYVTRARYEARMRAFRRQYGLAQDEPVWVLDGGWDIVSRPADASRPFTKAVRVFQTTSD